jgi:hypothetical protein
MQGKEKAESQAETCGQAACQTGFLGRGGLISGVDFLLDLRQYFLSQKFVENLPRISFFCALPPESPSCIHCPKIIYLMV